jgi:F0F1-type ATP synthase assembly protein I
MTKKILFFVFIMFLSSSVIFAVEKNPENQSPAEAGNKVEQKREQQSQAQLPVFEKKNEKKGFFQKRKERRAAKKFIKENAEALMSSMILVGAGLLIFGLLLYLVVTSAVWLGIAVMILGLVLLLYGVLTQFF